MGIGKAVNVAELAAIATSEQNVLQAKSFRDLLPEVEGIKQNICEGKNAFMNLLTNCSVFQ